MENSEALNRQQLVQQMAERVDGLSQKLAAAALQAALDAISDALVAGQSVQLSSFGTFNRRYRRSRVNQHPRTRLPVVVPGAWMAVFAPSTQLRRRLQEVPEPPA
ncbi:MAG: HU family DNA-binding protein [Anaerolineae bacterium]|nr:HU family DNA-binding protein [Gloeobacterales cyanobacterium ES-bin-313]